MGWWKLVLPGFVELRLPPRVTGSGMVPENLTRYSEFLVVNPSSG